MNKSKVDIKQNFTKPPNRFSEAGLIKKLEELGIGRPSTYDSIFTKLESNSYISRLRTNHLTNYLEERYYQNF